MSDMAKIDEILNYAIGLEEQAVELYTDLAGKAKSQAIKATFVAYANEEKGHKVKLQNVKAGKRLLGAEQAVQDLKIADYAVDVKLEANPDYQSVLLFAMQQEKAAFRLYSDLAAKTDDAEIKELLLGLAQEEAKHKLKFEIEYDEHVLTEN